MSVTDPLLTKAELISKAGSAYVKTYLRKEKNGRQTEERGKKVGNSNANTKVREKKGRGRSTPGANAEIPLQPVKETTLEQVFRRADIHTAAHGGPHTGAVGYFLKK